MPRWLGAVIVGACCVAFSSGLQPWVAALGGAFVPPDIAQDVAAARLFDARVSPYGPSIREMHARVVPVPVDETFPYFPHPPFSLLLGWPLAHVSFQVAALAWFSASLALTFMLAALLAQIASSNTSSSAGISGRAVLVAFGMLLAWPPVLYNLEKGQWSILLAVLVAQGWCAARQHRLNQAAAWMGGAAAVKVFPVILGAYWFLRSRKALPWFVGTGAFLTALPLMRIGFPAFPAFMGQSRLNLPYWETFPSVTFSIHGALARLLIGGQWAEPLVHAPTAARILEAAIIVVLLGFAAWTTVGARRGLVQQELTLAAWVTLLPMLNPQSLGHNGVLLAMPLVLVGRIVVAAGSTLQRAGWAAAVILTSIPRQTVWSLAPPPVAPWEGIVLIALPMWGTLMLFLVVLTLAPHTNHARTC